MPQKHEYEIDDLKRLLDDDFIVGMTVIRLAADLSKDEFTHRFKSQLGGGGIGIKRYRADNNLFLESLDAMKIPQAVSKLANRPVSWRDILLERLKAGRGSAIKGQARGRNLEDHAESIVNNVFGDLGYDLRCRFVGASGTSTEKADFAIPSKEEARILIEVKAYGATGSKQTDILGDITRIVQQKRHDTHLLLVTDGITWNERLNDLRKLIAMQNEGKIARIYTRLMTNELTNDLRTLRSDHAL